MYSLVLSIYKVVDQLSDDTYKHSKKKAPGIFLLKSKGGCLVLKYNDQLFFRPQFFPLLNSCVELYKFDPIATFFFFIFFLTACNPDDCSVFNYGSYSFVMGVDYETCSCIKSCKSFPFCD